MRALVKRWGRSCQEAARLNRPACVPSPGLEPSAASSPQGVPASDRLQPLHAEMRSNMPSANRLRTVSLLSMKSSCRHCPCCHRTTGSSPADTRASRCWCRRQRRCRPPAAATQVAGLPQGLKRHAAGCWGAGSPPREDKAPATAGPRTVRLQRLVMSSDRILDSRQRL